MLTFQELIHLSEKELKVELEKALKLLLEIKLQTKTGQSKAIHKVKNNHKYVAQIKTLLRSNQLQIKPIQAK